MICLNCGKHVGDDVRVCPFCGALIEAEVPGGAAADDPMPINLPHRESRTERVERAEYEAPKQAAPVREKSSLITPTVLLSLGSLVLSLLCLITLFSLRGTIAAMSKAQSESLSALNASAQAMNNRLDQLDSTIANVQAEAYDQVASQSITITKDITPLVGPVNEGKYNQMFIVKAKGNLNRETSFVWQRYNEATGGWVEVVFTGDATTNEQYGLRLENQYDTATGEYTTILWANGITKEAAGTYRCMIVDAGGISKTSAEATVSIAEAAE